MKDTLKGRQINDKRLKSPKAYYFIDYIPYNKGSPKESLAILNIKATNSCRDDRQATKHFRKPLRVLLKKLHRVYEDCLFCVIPSSDPTTAYFKKWLLKTLFGDKSLHSDLNGLDVIQRTSKLNKEANDKSKDYEPTEHIEISNDLIKDKVIILIDDIATTFSSLNAFRDLLIDGGAKNVIPVVLGKTISPYTS